MRRFVEDWDECDGGSHVIAYTCPYVMSLWRVGDVHAVTAYVRLLLLVQVVHEQTPDFVLAVLPRALHPEFV